MRVLCVAEKPSIAKSISQILSGGQFTTRPTTHPHIKNYEFNYPQTRSFYTVTAVLGHLTNCDFEEGYKKWNSCDAFDLFEAPIETKVDPDKKTIENNLRTQARGSDTLMIWTDCDREGEHIGLEIIRVCHIAKPNLQIKRARFSAIISNQIHHAAQNPVELDRRQAAAVEARITLDLRIGAAFTRMQTMILQNCHPELKESNHVVSYGPCQFPTLGFVVHRWKHAREFVAEPFWYIHVGFTREPECEGTIFKWTRNRLFDVGVATDIYEVVMTEPVVAKVVQVINKPTKKWKPLPLTTVELQKAGSRLLKLAPKRVLDIAEKLYQQGFLSYPRTETDQFDSAFDFRSLIQKQSVDQAWGEFASFLHEGQFSPPRKGKHNDKAHPPIHPTAHAGNLTGDDRKVYEYITRRFLASCSKDAIGSETVVEIELAGERFTATGLIVLEKNFLVVYPYEKWVSHELPNFRQGEEFHPTVCELREGNTTKPNLLTEADLVTLMDKNGIGTDATIAQHIQMIIDRCYVDEKMEGTTKYLFPSKLGIGLIEGYNQIPLNKSLSKPQLRRETERSMIQVCEGSKSKTEMLEEATTQYKEMFLIVRREFDKVVTTVRRYLSELEEDGDNDYRDGGDGDGPGPGHGRGSRGRGRGRGHSRGLITPKPDDGTQVNDRKLRTRARGNRKTPALDLADIDDLPSPPAAPKPFTVDIVTPPRPSNPSFPFETEIVTFPKYATDRAHIESGPQSAPFCNCDVPAGTQIVKKKSASEGKKFWTCGANRNCGFFKWFDYALDESTVVPVKRSFSDRKESEPRHCKCNAPAAYRPVTKENANQGRMFWICAKPQGTQCGYFVWDEETPPLERSKSGTALMGETSGSMTNRCFKCGEVGHWASSCTEDDSNKRRKSFGSLPDTNFSVQKCFNCQQPGHFQDACPSRGNMATRSNSNSFDTNCFKCGKEGHWSSSCPGGSNRREPSGSRIGECKKGRGGTSTRGRKGSSKQKPSFARFVS